MSIDWAAAAPWIIAASVFMFVASLIVFPIILIAVPADYFVRQGPRLGWLSRRHAAVRIILLVLKNLVGLALLAAGVVMLFTPGQGILSILVGLGLLDLPGKRRLEIALLCRPGILRALNAIRRKAGKPPFVSPHEEPSGDPS